MADIRINALATTATSSASDDYVAIDGSANGTRKLSAYSPTFGGNLTVSGTVSTANNVYFTGNQSLAAAGSIGVQAAAGLSMWPKTGVTYDFMLYDAAGNAALYLPTGTKNFTATGNLTVSGGSCILGSSTSVLYFGTPSSNYQYFDGTDLFWRIGGLDRMVIKSGGNLGIGTTSPDAKLNVVGSTNGGVGNVYLYDNAANAAGIGGGIAFGGIFTGSTSTPWAIIKGIKDNGDDGNFAGGMVFKTRTASAFGEAMRITSGGNLLLKSDGVDSSNGKLQLATHTTSAGGIGFGADSSLFSASATVLRFNGQNSDTQIQIAKNGTTGFGILVDGASTYITASGSSGVMYLRTNGGTTALTLDSSQNATFAGTVRSNAQEGFKIAAASGYFAGYEADGTTLNGYLQFINSTGTLLNQSIAGKNIALAIAGTPQLTITTGNATFAGSIAINNTVQTAAAVASTHKVTISIGGSTYYLLATNV